MKTSGLLIMVFCLAQSVFFKSISQVTSENKRVVVEWQNENPAGYIEVLNGKIESIKIIKGKGNVKLDHFDFKSTGTNRIEISLNNVKMNYGSGTTVVSVHTANNSFSFFLRDVSLEFPIYIPQYKVVVCHSDDKRSYQQIETEIQNQGLQTKLQRIEKEPEESFDSAAVHTRNQICPIWLGISRDIRIFELGSSKEMNIITPKMASSSMKLPEAGYNNVNYSYMTGRGQSVEQRISRRLEEGVLPILHTKLIDEDIEYNSITFVSPESSLLNEKSGIGTHYLVADYYSAGHMFTPEQQKILTPLLKADSTKTEETVLYYRAEALNISSVPRYAYFRTLRPGSGWWQRFSYSYNRETGFSGYSTDRIFGISKLNGKPLPNEEIAVLLKPNEKAVFEFYIPHDPISEKRALKLANQSFDEKHAECSNFWKAKLNNAAQIKLPEKRIEEMIKAGLLHLDLITYGNEPDGTLAPCIGVYSPIGTESSPIIQFFNSMGLKNNAERSLMYFLDKQHDDGMIQNFGGYMVETGAALWSMGEYFRYTSDTAWVRQVESKLLKSCDYLLKWREQNKKESLKGKGYGMIDGKVADPEDPFHQFMLNGYAYLGLSRVSEMLSSIDIVNSDRLKHEAELWRQDIRTSFFNSMAGSPVVPLGDGTWCPTVPPWTETKTLRLLYLYPETFMSHGTFTVSDAMLGPLYLVFCEVLDPKEQASGMMLDYHSELFYQRNAAFSQPYYSRHNWLQIKLGLVKPFLKTYYSTFSALADRETYTFWEHLYEVSVHKTHEEAWFLMETRWMLYLEDGNKLNLLSGIPRKWLEDGKKIEVKNVASYFGPLSFSVVSNVNKNYIEAEIECSSNRKPQEVTIRVPHPEGRKPVNVIGGKYDIPSETVIITPFNGKAYVKIEF
jgi:hypothetical protein